MNIWLLFGTVLIVALVDILIKEGIIKGWLLPKRYSGNWNNVPNFWKDSIPKPSIFDEPYAPRDRWYRIRWSYVLNGAGILLAGYWQREHYYGIVAGIAYWWLCIFNVESIMYQWFKKLVHLRNEDYKWFDLQDEMNWMKELPFNQWIGKYLYKPIYKEYGNCEPELYHIAYSVNPEVIYLVAILGTLVLCAVNELMKGA